MKNYYLFSQKDDQLIESFEKFDKQAILDAIKKHLTNNPKDTIELVTDYSKNEIKRYYGYKILDFYEVNPKNGLPSKCILKGDKTFYKKLS